ncbi:signal transducing adapter molecule 1 isoform X2 [Hyla sarda]|nr:signal transducing adapter molecule 1 isoform X2 [Hyla sarda]XP_056375160.1 signal transducing adapter molecule 1 isoform X2 [Hyla sarda]XP_056375161.1 signal transducing adapter molecule 1 isoform X2 [Hyla sarda]
MTVEDRVEQAYITSLIGFRPEKYFWTGLSDTEDKNTYKWANGQEVLYTHWNAHMPDRRQGCVAMGTGTKAGLWDVINCEEKTKYVCKKWAQGATIFPPSPATPLPIPCPIDWTPSGNACFKYYSDEKYEEKSWYEAREFCRAIGGDLLSIISSEDETAVLSMMSSHGSYKPIWIGLKYSNPDEGPTWSDGSPFSYESWYYQEPDTDNGQESCGALFGFRLKWRIVHCDTTWQWICKLKKEAILKEEPKPIEYEFTSDGWLIYNDRQYYISKDQVPMEKAQEFCNRNFSHLVTINSDLEQKFLWKYISTKRTEPAYYIGLRLGLDKAFKWMDGSPIDFVAWGKNQPNFSNNDEFCTEILTHKGLWNDINCGYPNAFICERTNSSINTTFAPTIPAPDGGCPSDWLSFGQKCYLISGAEEDKGVHWDDARRDCQSLGGNLATINNDLVQSFLMSNLRNVKLDVWIGLHDKNKENKFVWTDQSGVYYTNWAKGRPNIFRYHNDNCVALQYGSILDAGKWIDMDCRLNRGYICQKYKDPRLPVIPTTPSASNYYTYGDARYKFDKTKRSWDEARQECRKDNSQLASILDEYTTSFLKLHLVKHEEPFWIGLYSSNETKNRYKWVDNWKIHYTKWAAEEPSKDLSCVYVDTDGQWKTSSCNESYSSICKKTNAVASTNPPDTPGLCPNTSSKAWIPFGNHCYFFETSSAVWWQEATLECLHHGGSLTSIEDLAELDFLHLHTELLSDRQETFWIGLYKNVEGKWLWFDKTPMDFVNWNNEGPHGEMSSKCVMMNARKGTWDMTRCTGYRGYICKTLKTLLPTETLTEKQEEKPSHGVTIGVVLLVILVVAASAIAVFFVYRRKWNKSQPENSFNNRIYFDSNCEAATQDGNALVENIVQNEAESS